jgi:hypothetical protein
MYTRGLKTSALVITLIVCLLGTATSFSIARLVDPQNHPDSLLDTLVDDLDKNKINVRRGNGIPAGLTPSSRPQLARLGNFPIAAGSPEVSTYFKKHFEAGVFTDAYLVAVHGGAGDNTPLTSETEFKVLWDSAPQDSRIFLSFTGTDIHYAEIVAVTLRAHGYTVFMYMNKSSQYPSVNSVEVGKYFKTAGGYLVLDSANARKSKGVRIEAIAYMTLTGRIGRPPPASGATTAPRSPPRGPSPLGGATSAIVGFPCCKVCTYRNGILIGCGPRECGPQCKNATKGPGSTLERSLLPELER